MDAERQVWKLRWKTLDVNSPTMSTDENIRRSRNVIGSAWCFTINDIQSFDFDIFALCCKISEVAYVVIGKERAPTTGHVHYQGYVRFKIPITFQRLKDAFGPDCHPHLEVAICGDLKNREYCAKENLIFEEGTLIQPIQCIKGRVTKQDIIQMLMQDVMRGQMSFDELAMKYPEHWFYNKKRIFEMRIDTLSYAGHWDGNLKNKNFWIWGPPGVGKTKWARSLAPTMTYAHGCSKWWDGFNPFVHRIVVLDDWPARLDAGVANALAQHLKQWGDRYPIQGEVKGSTIPVIPGAFFLIVTSNYPIEDCFPNPEDVEAFKRRFSVWELQDRTDVRLQLSLDFSILDRLT